MTVLTGIDACGPGKGAGETLEDGFDDVGRFATVFKLDVQIAPTLVGEGLEEYRNMSRSGIALYVGGMGAKERNFYNQVFRKYGYEKEAEVIQDLYLAGRKSEAEAAIPDSYLEATSLVGPEGFVRDRLAAFKDAGVTSLNVSFLGTTTEERVRNCDKLANLIAKM